MFDWWNPSVRRLTKDRDSREVWVRILGLPLHLWGMSLLQNLGKHVVILWVLTRTQWNVGTSNGPGFSSGSNGGISSTLYRWWLVLPVSQSNCGERLLDGSTRCNLRGVVKVEGERMRASLGHVPSREVDFCSGKEDV